MISWNQHRPDKDLGSARLDLKTGELKNLTHRRQSRANIAPKEGYMSVEVDTSEFGGWPQKAACA